MQLDMTQGSPARLILKFIIPIIIGNIFQQFYNMVDAIIVGTYVGNKALAAVGATGTISFLIIGFMQGITAGFTVLTSQRFGARDEVGVKRSVGNAALLSVVVTAITTVLSLIFMRPLLRVMNTPEDIFDMSYRYISIICLGMWTNILYNLLASFLRAVGNSKVPLYFLAISAGLNIVLDLVFIIWFNMGVAGAAWATVISQGVSGILCLLYISKKVPLLHPLREHWRFHEMDTKNQLQIGIPMALQFSITAVGTIIVQSALNLFGSTVVAAYTAASKLQQLVTQPFPAMGQTMATYSAQNSGKGDIERIWKGVRASEIMTCMYGVFGGILLVLIAPFGIRLFINENLDEIMIYANLYLRICAMFFVPLGLIFIYRNALQGAGYGILPMLGGVVELVARASVAFIAAHFMSYAGVCAGDVSAWVAAAVFLLISYYSIYGKKRKLSLPEKEGLG